MASYPSSALLVELISWGFLRPQFMSRLNSNKLTTTDMPSTLQTVGSPLLPKNSEFSGLPWPPVWARLLAQSGQAALEECKNWLSLSWHTFTCKILQISRATDRKSLVVEPAVAYHWILICKHSSFSLKASFGMSSFTYFFTLTHSRHSKQS